VIVLPVTARLLVTDNGAWKPLQQVAAAMALTGLDEDLHVDGCAGYIREL
jgi:hypothetical protein